MSEEIEVDWANLPADMLRKISKRLHDIAEFILFRAVCKRWRTATSISDPPPLIPWLLEEPDPRSGVLRFYSLFSNTLISVPFPQSLEAELFGPYHGYFCAEDCIGNYSLLNPLTKHEVKIQITEHFSRPMMLCMRPDRIINDGIVFTCVRIHTDEDENDLMGFYQLLSGESSYVEVPPGCGNLYGEAYLNGLFYMEFCLFHTSVVDIASGTSYIIPLPRQILRDSDTVYFVESAEKILRIVRRKVLAMTSFDIYELDLEGKNGQPRWIKISCIGDQVLFLDGDSGISVTASESTGLKRNCIYYLNKERERYMNFREGSSVVCRFNLENRQIESIPCPFNKLSTWTWFVPSVTGSRSDGLH